MIALQCFAKLRPEVRPEKAGMGAVNIFTPVVQAIQYAHNQRITKYQKTATVYLLFLVYADTGATASPRRG